MSMPPKIETILQKQQGQIDSLQNQVRENEEKQVKHDAEISAIREEMKNLRSVLSRYEVNFRVNNMRDQKDTACKPEHIDVNESSDDNEVVKKKDFVPNDLMEGSTATSGMVHHNKITSDSERKDNTENINRTNDSTEDSSATSRAVKTASHIIRGPALVLQKDIGGDVNNTYDDKITNDSERKEITEDINITIESNSNTNIRNTLQVIRRRAGGLITRYVIGSKRRNSDNGLYVSDSFHMYTAATISDGTCSPVFGWFVTLLSNLIIIAQVIVLMSLVLESSHPTCISHEECKVGEYCSVWWEGPPRCGDCGTLKDVNLYCWSVIGKIKKNGYTKYVNKIAWKTDEMYTELEVWCFAQAHCSETDLSEACEFLQYEMFKSTVNQQLAIVFMSLLFCAPIIGYITDAIVEEKYLNYALKNYPVTRTMKLAAEMLRVAIRTRQILLPWLGMAAVLSIIIRDPLNVKNLMLNVLAVEVTLIADDLLAIIVLPIFNTDAVVKLAQDASREGLVESLIWPRILAISIGIVLITSIFYMPSLLIIFTGRYDDGLCSSMDNMIFTYIDKVLPMSAILLRRFGGFIIDKLKKMTWAKTTLRFVAKTTMDFLVTRSVSWLAFGVVFHILMPRDQFQIFYFIVKPELYPSQIIWLSIILLAVFICGHAVRIFSSWTPFRYLYDI